MKDISLQPYNTFGLDVKANYFLEFTSLEELKFGLNWSKDNSVENFILGGGSNILLTTDLDFLVMKNSLSGIGQIKEDKEHVWVKAQGGEIWHDFVMYCIDQGWGGIENLSLIPGSVGAAPMQNIGAYGVEIKDVFDSLEALNIETEQTEVFEAKACQFGYRESVFKRALKGKYVITSMTLKLSKQPRISVSYGAIEEVLKSHDITEPTIKDVSNAVIEIRQSKLPDPTKIGNSGSFFKNPVIPENQFEQLKIKHPNIPSYSQSSGDVKVPAGWLIDQAGWKGYRRGDIGVHDKQALVLVNHGGGNGSEIRQLSEDIKASIKEQFGITLETEVNLY
ncbi:UDP-N-acetylmuramate dehydrogenase [Reichenbachiella versicolor]|uniref:UDP-N-acetylmuramate dehydrogenase n=1 Tax=Reichenbachiella versicolor TaxID=1821036 RepID=UPI002936EC21|nr:UDP-N-acetylmuramate dehydrogenase [Reichenbachiella versicolor]